MRSRKIFSFPIPIWLPISARDTTSPGLFWGLEKNKLSLSLSADNEIDGARKKHIHATTLEFDDNDRMTHWWTSFADGKKAQVVKIAYNRIR